MTDETAPSERILDPLRAVSAGKEDYTQLGVLRPIASSCIGRVVRRGSDGSKAGAFEGVGGAHALSG